MGLRLTGRERVLLLVAGLGALGGAIAGATTALLAAAVLTPSEPVTAGDIALMATGYGVVAALCGAVLGTGLAFGLLRGVRLARVFVFGTAGATLGLAYGFLGGPWAWHHFAELGIGGMVIGALASRLRSGRTSLEERMEARLASWVATRAQAATGEGGGAAAIGSGPATPVSVPRPDLVPARRAAE